MPDISPGPHISSEPWIAAGPFAVLDSERNTIVKCAGPRKAANQALVAAAPDLLAALTAILHTELVKTPGNVNEFEIRAEVLEQARQAIRKAKGGIHA